MTLNIVYGIMSVIFSVMMLVCIIMMYNTCMYTDVFGTWYFNARLIVGVWFSVSAYLLIRTLFKKYGIMKSIDLDSFGPLLILISTISLVLYIMVDIIKNIAGFR